MKLTNILEINSEYLKHRPMLRISVSTRIRKIMDILFSLDCFHTCENLYICIHIQALVPRQETKSYVESSWANTWMLCMRLKFLLCCIYSLFYSFMPKIGYLSYNGPGYSILWSDPRVNSKRTEKRVLVPQTYRSRERVDLFSHNKCSSPEESPIQ